MIDSRERDVTQAFVSLASHLANGYDVVDLLNDLTVDCARLLDIASAGLLLADGRGVLHVMAASSDRTRQLEVFQLQRAEGPCRDCFHGRAAISVPDLAAESARWPQFVPAALDAGFVSVHALPMRLRDNVLGALGLFGTTVGALGQDDLSLGQALADVASVAFVQDNAAADRIAVNEQLQTSGGGDRVPRVACGGSPRPRPGQGSGPLLTARSWCRIHEPPRCAGLREAADRAATTPARATSRGRRPRRTAGLPAPCRD